jgi:hypothetical protein
VASRQFPRPTTWLRYDLKSPDPIGRVDLGDYRPTKDDPPARGDRIFRGTPFLIDLSPSGDRLAIQPTYNPPRVHVWDAEGKRAAKLKPVKPAEPVTWFGFIDDARALTLEAGRLRLRELGSGEVKYTVDGKFVGQVVLSPKRAWAAAFDGTAFVWVRTADGVVGGRTPLPTLRAGEFVGTVYGAFSPDGTRFLASRPATAPMGHFRCLSVWNVADGKPTEAGDYQVPNGLREHVQRCGPRQVLLGGARMIDLDLAEYVWEYTPRDRNGCTALSIPDGRFWYVPNCRRPQEIASALELLKDSRYREQVEKSGYVVTAWTMPHAEARTRIDAHRNARVLGQLELRVAVRHDDPAFCRQAGEVLADSLAAVGSRVSPKAAGLARLTVGAAKDGQVEEFAGNLGGRQVRYVPGKVVEAKLEVFDQSKTSRWAVTFRGEAKNSATSPAATAQKKMLDNLRRVIAGGKSTVAGTDRLPSLRTWSELGIDGLPDPPPGDQPKK